ncbi:MAG TPA: DNA mismatch repair protein MutS [Stellaceae bacterium]|nr:DNA mismatch repair protein MutS [Stellaceae bacterium]
MKAFLMYRDRDFDPKETPPPGAPDLVQNLGLEVLVQAMAAGDSVLLEVARTAVLSLLPDVAAVLYRQDILRDCLANAATVRRLYDLTVETIQRERKHYWGVSSRSPGFLLHSAVNVLQLFVEMMRRLRREADAHAAEFSSDGFTTLFATLQRELDDDYLGTVEEHLARLKFRNGVLISARLGRGNLGIDHTLRKPNDDGRPWLRRLFGREQAGYTFRIHERDEAGAQAVAELSDRGINHVANAVTQSNEHILSFFRMLRTELAFYIGCLNLYERLAWAGGPVCYPAPAPRGERRLAFRGLYDASLVLAGGGQVVGNDCDGDGKELIVITGANQGGKSTFLRSIGLAQLMMQCGMFVPARSFRANLCTGVFSHYKREEDATMRAGKFEEELQRISAIIDGLSPDSLLLFNESFQSTNEREGSEIGEQIIRALLEGRIKVCFVTHMHDLATRCSRRDAGETLFLRAERREDGTRTFRILPGAPLSTSHGRDLYDEIFGVSTARRQPAAATADLTAGSS